MDQTNKRHNLRYISSISHFLLRFSLPFSAHKFLLEIHRNTEDSFSLSLFNIRVVLFLPAQIVLLFFRYFLFHPVNSTGLKLSRINVAMSR